jgi:osmoprotectant transport system ATP-binding protein
MRQGGHLVQYGTPEEILLRPADDFVAKFVGADRGLKALSLATLGELKLAEPNGDRPALRLQKDVSVRDALSMMLASDDHHALVLDGDMPLGIASVDLIADLLSGERV